MGRGLSNIYHVIRGEDISFAYHVLNSEEWLLRGVCVAGAIKTESIANTKDLEAESWGTLIKAFVSRPRKSPRDEGNELPPSEVVVRSMSNLGTTNHNDYHYYYYQVLASEGSWNGGLGAYPRENFLRPRPVDRWKVPCCTYCTIQTTNKWLYLDV